MSRLRNVESDQSFFEYRSKLKLKNVWVICKCNFMEKYCVFQEKNSKHKDVCNSYK